MRRRLRRWTFGAALCCAATLTLLVSASAQDVTRAHLLTVPDATALSDHFPPVALATGVSGRVVLSCAIALDGSSECSAAEETPANAGFGAAAVALAQDWRFSPRVEGGHAVASVSRVPIEFQNQNARPLPIEMDIPVDGVPADPDQVSSERGFDPQAEGDNRIVITASRVTSRRPREAPPPAAPPARQDLNSRFYPRGALQGSVSGRALIACAVDSSGRIACGVEQEAPAGHGFGEQAVSLVTEMAAHNNPTLAAGSVFRVPVDFATHNAGERPVARFHWSTARPQEPFGRIYPVRAVERNIEGDVTLICTIRADRSVDCGVNEERPVGWSFGASAVRLSQSIVVREESLGMLGVAVGDSFRVGLSYRGQ